jgi:hypothetical protein
MEMRKSLHNIYLKKYITQNAPSYLPHQIAKTTGSAHYQKVDVALSINTSDNLECSASFCGTERFRGTGGEAQP